MNRSLLYSLPLVVLCLACFAPTPGTKQTASTAKESAAKDDKDTPVVWEKVGNTVAIGDLRITAHWAMPSSVGMAKGGRIVTHPNVMTVRISIRNSSEKKAFAFGGWTGDGLVLDEQGKEYTPYGFARDEQFVNPFTFSQEDNKAQETCDHEAITAGAETIRPGKCVSRILFFDAPGESMKEARIALPGKPVGSSVSVHLKLPVSRWDMKLKKMAPPALP